MKAEPEEYHRKDSDQSAGKSWPLRILVTLLVLLLLFYVLVFWLAPWAGIRYAKSWYAEQGEGYELTVEGWTLSPFTGEIALDGVVASYPSAADGSGELATVGAQHVGLNVDLAALLGKNIEIDTVGISGLVFTGKQSEEGLRMAGILIPAGEDTSADVPEDESTEASTGVLPEGWTLAIGSIDLTENRVGWEQDGLSIAVVINDIETGAFSSAVEADTPVQLEVTLSELDIETGEDRIILNSPITLTLNGKARSILTHPEFTTDAQFTGLDMHVPGVENLNLGPLTLKGLGFAMAEDGMRAALDELILEDSSAGSSATRSAELGSLTITQLGWNQQRDRISAKTLSLKQANAVGAGFNDLTVDVLDLSDIDVNQLSGDVGASVGHLMLSGANADRGDEGKASFALLELADIVSSKLTTDAEVSIGSILLQQPMAEQVGTGNFTLQELQLGAVKAVTLMSDPAVDVTSIAFKTLDASAFTEATGKAEVSLEGLILTDISSRTLISAPAFDLASLRLQALNTNIEKYASVNLAEFAVDEVSGTDLTGEFNVGVTSASLQTLAADLQDFASVTLDDLSVNTIQAGVNEQTAALASLNNLRIDAEGQDEPVVSLDQYKVTDIRATAEELLTGKHSFAGLVAHLTREQDGNLRGLPASAEEQTAAAQSEQQAIDESTDSTGFIVRIGGIEMLPSATKSQVYWTDHAVSPSVSTRVSILEVSTGPMDTSQLAQKSPINIVLALDDYNRISLNGNLGLEGEYPAGKVKFNIEQLNLVDFNPYLVDAMGYRLKKGMLNINSDITITDGELGGNAKIKLQNSKFEPADEATINRISKQISMPLETALSVLKDDNNNINMDVALSGNIKDPNVGLDDILDQVSIKALKAATMYYLQQSLVPYGQFISIGSFVKDQLFAIRLKDLEFEAQVTELSDANKEYLDTVAGMMKSKTGLELQVCPIASEDEAKVWGDNWSAEVAKRSANVKAYLATVKDSKDKPLSGRVTLCTPKKGDDPMVILGV